MKARTALYGGLAATTILATSATKIMDNQEFRDAATDHVWNTVLMEPGKSKLMHLPNGNCAFITWSTLNEKNIIYAKNKTCPDNFVANPQTKYLPIDKYIQQFPKNEQEQFLEDATAQVNDFMKNSPEDSISHTYKEVSLTVGTEGLGKLNTMIDQSVRDTYGKFKTTFTDQENN